MADNVLGLNLIDDILKGNFNDAEKILHQDLAQKQNDVLDQEKIKMAGRIFNNQPIEDEPEVELTDDEIEDAVNDEAEELADDETSEEETEE